MIDLVGNDRQKLNHCCTLRRAFTYENKSHVHGSAVYLSCQTTLLCKLLQLKLRRVRWLNSKLEATQTSAKRPQHWKCVCHMLSQAALKHYPSTAPAISLLLTRSCDVTHSSANPANLRSQGSKLALQKRILLKPSSSIC